MIEGAQKTTKMYNELMRSGKFTAAQNKAEQGEYVDSISELVAICERDGFIPRYYVDTPQDKVDRTIQDLQEYTTNLITEEMHLGALIERAVHQMESDNDKDDLEDEIDEEEALEKELYEHNEEEDYNTEEDYSEFNEFQEDLERMDEEMIMSLLEGDE